MVYIKKRNCLKAYPIFSINKPCTIHTIHSSGIAVLRDCPKQFLCDVYGV